MKKKIAIFGTYPPPIGGTSIHVKRLSLLLSNEYDVTVYDTYGSGECNENVISIKNYKKFLLLYLFNGKDDIIHSHTHSWNERLILSIISKLKRKKIIFTYHSLREEWDEKRLLNKIICKLVFMLSDMNIAVGESIEKKLIEWGINKKKVKVIRPFLLPSKKEVSDFREIDGLEAFLDKHKFIICANASNNNKYKGQDLYGIDMIIDLCYNLKKEKDIGIVLALTKITDEKYYSNIKQMIISKGLEGDIFIINENISFLPIIKRSDIFVRPTNTDGFSLSVVEAIYMGVPTVASDIVERYDGTVLFETRNSKDFNDKVMNIINNYTINKKKLENIHVKDSSKEILNLYKDLG